ncbi:MAG: LysR substrate-binding domain-containing protein [Lautropia sp.]
MNLQQLAVFKRIVDSDFSISNAATALGISQPLASRQLQALEAALDVQLFHRRKRRLTGLTEAGKAVLDIAPGILQDVESIRAVGREFSSRDTGDLTIATTHTYARHLLPDILKRFAQRYPGVRIFLRQGNPIENAREVAQGQADLFIAASEPGAVSRESVVQVPFARIDRVVVVPVGHPLSTIDKPGMRDLGRYPLVTFSGAFSARTRLLAAFAKVGVAPNVVLSATDAEVIKTYVRLGMGITVLSSLSVSPGERDLVCIDARHLFRPDVIYLGLRRHSYLRSFQMDLISMLAPRLKRSVIESRLREPA